MIRHRTSRAVAGQGIKQMLRPTLLACILLIVVSLLAPAAMAQTGPYSISGNVRSAGTLYYPDGAKILVKLVQGSAVLRVTSPDPITGNYSFTALASGSYRVVLSSNDSAADASAVAPGTWAFSNPATGYRTVTVGATSVSGVNFELTAHCVCGYTDGRLTLKTIPMSTNGDLSAWGDVTEDSDNNSCDGDPDPDIPIQSTGRDLVQFSYTWDSQRLYGYTVREASESNTDNFIYYADVNANGRMEDGEPVIYVGWSGSNRTVNVGVGQYLAANRSTGWDPLSSPTTGKADGYDMPGKIVNGNLLRSGAWGSLTGTAMQWYVTWAELGIPSNTGIRWHISSTNSTPTANSLPSQIDDNMGGCGGCAASSQYGGVSIAPARSLETPPSQAVYIAHTIQNTGNGLDAMNLVMTSSGAWSPTSVTYYKDNGVVGTYEPGVDTLLTDSTADGLVDTGALASGASINVIAAVAVPSATGQSSLILKATSTYVPSCGAGISESASITDTVMAGYAISGFVYNDANHNSTKDASEVGSGLTLYAKLVPQNASAATSVVAINTATGAYTFPRQVVGNYTVVVGTENSTSILTPATAAGWVFTESYPGSRTVALTSADVPNNNVGVYNGSVVLNGLVFEDNGVSGGTANNGVNDGGEAGLAGVTVTVTNATGATVYDSAISDAAGSFRLYFPATSSGVVIRRGATAGYLATNGSAGTTGGTYAQKPEAVTFTNAAGTVYSGIRFGDVKVNTLSNTGAASVQVGTTAYYPHTFVAGTAGSVTFTTASVLNPTPQSGWSERVFLDSACSGTFNASYIDITGQAQTVSANTTVCVLVREMVPTPAQGTNTVTLTAAFQFANNAYLNQAGVVTAPSRVDTTTVVFAISGYVYSDANHSSLRDASEAGTGVVLYAKLVPQGSASATTAVAVNTSTGAYAIAPQIGGTYSIVIDTNNTLTDISAGYPAGWVALENPTGSSLVTLTNNNVDNVNFGLYSGSRVTGTVFVDSGSGAGVANNGSQDGSEAGLAGVAVSVTNSGNTTTYSAATTDASGAFTLWLPSTATTVVVRRTPTAGHIATGGRVGTTAGTYSRTEETVSFTTAVGASYSGVQFGSVPINTLSTDGSKIVNVGTDYYYPHQFVAGTAGMVTFSTSSTTTPAQSGWAEAIYLDANCSGTFDAGETMISAAQSVVAGQTVCLLMRESVPSSGRGSALTTLSALFTYSNASPSLSASVTRTDTTTAMGSPSLTISKTVDKSTAYPGDVLTYTITFSNASYFSATNVSVQDDIPAATTYVAASCASPLPDGITGCAITAPAVGDGGQVVWNFSGSLAGQASGTVTLKVKIK